MVLFLVSTKDITERYRASRGPSMYSMDSETTLREEVEEVEEQVGAASGPV